MQKRLSRESRRRLLLDAAVEFIKVKGVEALTLTSLAKYAKTSKPLVYDHFSSNEGLLIELCHEFDARQRAEISALVSDDKMSLKGLLFAVAHSYIASETARDWQKLSAVMVVNTMTAAVYHEMSGNHIRMLMSAIGPRTAMKTEKLRIICAGLIGSADAITANVLRGGTDIEAAAAALFHIFHGSFPDEVGDKPGTNH